VCNPAAAATIAGADVTITLAPNAAVVCTYSDTRVDPPVPPEPPTPPPGPPPPPPPPPTEIVVVKTMPRVARVGRRISFRLRVTNTGSVPATNVRLADIPPAAVTLSALRASARPKVGARGALWRIGTLAPGQSRTIRGSVLVDAGTPGRVRNFAVATAVNAQLALDRADARILAQGIRGQQEQNAPSVTG